MRLTIARLKKMIEDAEAAHVSPARIEALRKELAELESEALQSPAPVSFVEEDEHSIRVSTAPLGKDEFKGVPRKPFKV
ncbi:hypothetical protein WA1_27175 [Scytonema hofmannii PCC 7110]|uniref:Uncharacterized protein n=1 Tax=Scytonema hofmannii PCC 7110 TaxID=128403 RepID=A0A139X6H1_9CYAN|nr:hypothetical protein [Scytonema hofmannii]KYC40222.1 hypothetical protein WA1_27175 [Scytonema hofmannii PCC 7110]